MPELGVTQPAAVEAPPGPGASSDSSSTAWNEALEPGEPGRSASGLIPNDLLQEIYSTETVRDGSGQTHPLHSAIPYEYAAALYELVRESRAKLVVEVGMAFGLSSLAILTALDQVGGEGRLLSIDPNQMDDFHGVGVANVSRSGLSARHELIEARDYLALPDLLSRRQAIDFAYIDGWHTFDYTLLDFFYLDKMLSVGGILGFNDCKWPAVRKVLGFLRGHRKYERLKVTTSLDRQKGRFLKSLYRKVFGTPDHYFRKVEDWEPNYDYYAGF